MSFNFMRIKPIIAYTKAEVHSLINKETEVIKVSSDIYQDIIREFNKAPTTKTKQIKTKSEKVNNTAGIVAGVSAICYFLSGHPILGSIMLANEVLLSPGSKQAKTVETETKIIEVPNLYTNYGFAVFKKFGKIVTLLISKDIDLNHLLVKGFNEVMFFDSALPSLKCGCGETLDCKQIDKKGKIICKNCKNVFVPVAYNPYKNN